MKRSEYIRLFNEWNEFVTKQEKSNEVIQELYNFIESSSILSSNSSILYESGFLEKIRSSKGAKAAIALTILTSFMSKLGNDTLSKPGGNTDIPGIAVTQGGETFTVEDQPEISLRKGSVSFKDFNIINIPNKFEAKLKKYTPKQLEAAAEELKKETKGLSDEEINEAEEALKDLTGQVKKSVELTETQRKSENIIASYEYAIQVSIQKYKIGQTKGTNLKKAVKKIKELKLRDKSSSGKGFEKVKKLVGDGEINNMSEIDNVANAVTLGVLCTMTADNCEETMKDLAAGGEIKSTSTSYTGSQKVNYKKTKKINKSAYKEKASKESIRKFRSLRSKVFHSMLSQNKSFSDAKEEYPVSGVIKKMIDNNLDYFLNDDGSANEENIKTVFNTINEANKILSDASDEASIEGAMESGSGGQRNVTN